MITAKDIIASEVWQGAMSQAHAQLIDAFEHHDSSDIAGLAEISQNFGALRNMRRVIEAKMIKDDINKR